MESQLIPTNDRATSKLRLLSSEVKTLVPVVSRKTGEIFYIFLSILTCGLLPLILLWNKKLWISLRFISADIKSATHLILTLDNHAEILLPIEEIEDLNGKKLRVVTYRYVRYFVHQAEFTALRCYLSLSEDALVSDAVQGLSDSFAANLFTYYGANNTLIQVDSVSKLVFEQVFTSFNIYQIYAILIWTFLRDYLSYAMLILVTAVVSILVEVKIIRDEQRTVNKMQISSDVTVFRRLDGRLRKLQIDSNNLVPGDLIEIESNEFVPADCAILEGACHVDESILTGESVPVFKPEITRSATVWEEKKQNMLYMGTKCLTSYGPSGKAKAVVIQTGFSTERGSLIRSLMFLEVGQYRHERDAQYFVLFLIFLSGILIVVFSFMHKDVEKEDWL